MNSIIRIIALIFVVAALCGCGKSSDEIIMATETVGSVVEATEEATDEVTIIDSETEPTVIVEDVRWDVPGEEYTIDITHAAETDLERLAWAIYLEGGEDGVCDDCRRRIADVILNRVECKITNTGNDLYWPDTITDVISYSGINPYQNMGNSFAWPKTAYKEGEQHSVERAFRIAHEVLRGSHSEVYRKGYFYYAAGNEYGYEPWTAIHHCGIYFMRQRGWDNSKFEQDWFLIIE